MIAVKKKDLVLNIQTLDLAYRVIKNLAKIKSSKWFWANWIILQIT